MEREEKSERSTAPVSERPTCSAAVLYGGDSNGHQSLDDAIIPTHHHCTGSSTVRNIEIDWREVDPYFSELSDCASFWTLINFTCDVIYSGLFVLFFIMGQDVESMFFEGLLNHINPILIYLILSLTINYGALRSLRCGREKCFLTFSITKALLFPITISLLLYLIFWDVQEYFGTFWVSFVVIVSCYNLTAALGLWSMFICNKYILVNEAAQKRIRKQTKQQRLADNQGNCPCRGNAKTPSATLPHSNNANKQCSSSSRTCSSQLRKTGDSSCANRQLCKPDNNSSINSDSNFVTSVKCTKHIGCNSLNQSLPPNTICAHSSNRSDRLNLDQDILEGDALSFEEDEVLQISTVHKVMQEIRLLDAAKNRCSGYDNSDEGDSL